MPVQRHPVDLRKMYEKICMQKYRNFHLKISISFQIPLFAFVMAFIMGGKMACIFLLVVPVLGFGLYMVIRTAMPLFRKVFHKYDELNNSIQENIKGMRVVKSYVREEFEKEKFDRIALIRCCYFCSFYRLCRQ